MSALSEAALALDAQQKAYDEATARVASLDKALREALENQKLCDRLVKEAKRDLVKLAKEVTTE